MVDTHSDTSPSRLERIIQCPGSVGLISSLTQVGSIKSSKPSSYALQGTKLHEKLARQLWSHDIPEDLSQEENNVLTECVEYIKLLSHANPINAEFIERHVTLKSWGVPEVYGTADYAIFNAETSHVDIIDWKFGSGIIVYARDNPQLMAYAAGMVEWPTTTKTITIHIFQPYLNHVSTWDMTIAELHFWVFGTLAPAIFEANYGDGKLNPSVKACRWCEAKNFCTAHFELVKQSAIEIFEAQQRLPNKIKPEELVNIISKAPLVEQAIKDMKLFVKTEIERGIEYPGLKVVSGRTNRSWKDESATIKWLNDHTNIEELFTSKLRSPSQFEKESRDLKKDLHFQDLYEKTIGKPALVFEADPRPALSSPSVAIDVFKDYKKEPK